MSEEFTYTMSNIGLSDLEYFNKLRAVREVDDTTVAIDPHSIWNTAWVSFDKDILAESAFKIMERWVSSHGGDQSLKEIYDPAIVAAYYRPISSTFSVFPSKRGHSPQEWILTPPESVPELNDALEDLRECQDEAREQDFPIPTETALNNAERLLKTMFNILPRRFEVYPMPNGAITIQASKAPKIAISVLCEPDGGALCLVSAPDHSRRAWYSTANILPDGFLYEALSALGQFEG